MEKFVYKKEGLKLTKPDEIVVEQREDIKALKEENRILKKALEIAREECVSYHCSDYCGTIKDCENCWWRNFYTAEYFENKAKEMRSE